MYYVGTLAACTAAGQRVSAPENSRWQNIFCVEVEHKIVGKYELNHK